MTPYFTDDLVTLHHGDCLDVMRALPDASVDAVVTDPPYGLEFMGKEWDRLGDIGKAKNRGMGGIDDKKMTLPESYNADVNVKCGACRRWRKDHADRKCVCVAPDFPNVRAQQARAMQAWHEQWVVEALRVLKPGGHLLAFGGSRTWHRLAIAVEDAGFEVRDSIAWLYASGFPKSLDVSKAIDKAGGDPLAFLRFAAAYSAAVEASSLTHTDIDRHLGIKSSSCYWARTDHRGGLPPRHHWEAVRDLLALDAELAALYDEAERHDRIVRDGGESGSLSSAKVGVINAGRPVTDAAKTWQGWGTALKPAFEPIVVGRKPLAGTVAGNVLAHGTGALNIDACRTAAGQDYADKCASVVGLDSNRNGDAYGEWTGTRQDSTHAAGRWPANVVLDSHAADELDRSSISAENGIYGKAPADRAGVYESDSGGASRFFPTFRYEAKAPTSERPRDGETAHPTVKPLDLMRWLVRLVTPPGGVVLEPFAGSGTTAEACVIEGFRCIAIEREAAYLPLIVARLSKPIQPDLFGASA